MEVYLKLFDDNYYLSAEYLIGAGMNRRTLNNYISKFRKGRSKSFNSLKDKHTAEKWIMI